MAKRPRKETYYSRSAEISNRRLNIALRSQEKIYEDFEVQDYRETEPTYQNMTAPTINPPRPRAKKIAYSREAQKLVIKFRDGTWWEYNDVSSEIWLGLKQSGSTGRYLRASGLDNWHDMGPATLDDMSPGAKERISQAAQIGSRMNSRIPLPDDFNIKNVTAKELFNDIL
jgi:hypothetical protein